MLKVVRTEAKPQAKQEVTPDRCQADQSTPGPWPLCSVQVEPPSLGLETSRPTFRPNGTDVEVSTHTTLLWLQSAGAALQSSCESRQVFEPQHRGEILPLPMHRWPSGFLTSFGALWLFANVKGNGFVRQAHCLLQNAPLLRNLRALPSKAS